MRQVRTAAAAVLALLAFAGNSLLCRSALVQGSIDPAAFTWIRLASGALVLGLLARARNEQGPSRPWAGALALGVYAVAFSFAYVRLPAGVGALVLFGATQVTMLGWGLRKGDRPSVVEWLGIVIAVLGLAFLAAPGRTAPDLGALVLMALAGVGWGTYSLRGRRAGDPIVANASAFLRAAGATLVLVVLPFEGPRFTTRGVGLAVLSGAVASGLGYCLWYAALPHLTRTRAAALQLTVPVLAALAGVALLRETLTLRLLAAGALTLGGVGLTLAAGARGPRSAMR